MARDFYDELTNHAVSVSGTATLLTAQRAHHNRTAALVQNTGVDVLYIGGPGVTTANGLRLGVNEHITVEGPVPLYGVSVGSSEARVIEFQ